jgi:hypothetical protein
MPAAQEYPELILFDNTAPTEQDFEALMQALRV